VLKGVGHCPQDEAPHLVNPIIHNFVLKHSAKAAAAAVAAVAQTVTAAPPAAAAP
jgi:hypothetical protein